MLAGLVARHMFEHAQRHVRFLAAQAVQGIQGQAPAGRLGGEEEQAVELLSGEGLELGEQRGEGLADPGGGLRHQGLAIAGGAVDRFGQLALATAKLRIRKGQSLQTGIARLAMCLLLLRPGDEAPALQGEEGLQLRCGEGFAKHAFLLRQHIEIDDRQLDLVQPLALAEQPAIHLHLRPVQQAVVFRDAGDVAAVGLDLLEEVLPRVIAIGAAADHQARPGADQGQLGLVVRAAARHHRLVPGNAFLGGRRGGEAQVEITFLGGELAQGAHGYRIGHAPAQLT
ncbi:hypothetical protein D3C81_1404820 [compost metagenome]